MGHRVASGNFPVNKIQFIVPPNQQDKASCQLNYAVYAHAYYVLMLHVYRDTSDTSDMLSMHWQFHTKFRRCFEGNIKSTYMRKST